MFVSCGEAIATALLVGVREGGFAHPGAVFPGLHAIGEAVAVALAVAIDDVPELGPVDRAEVPMATLLVESQFGVGQRDAEDLGLWHGGVDELLPKVVVADALDAPLDRIARV